MSKISDSDAELIRQLKHEREKMRARARQLVAKYPLLTTTETAELANLHRLLESMRNRDIAAKFGLYSWDIKHL